MSKQALFEDDSDEEINFKTENEYAKKYDSWRGKEEIHKLEQKYGSATNADGSLTTDSEDESDELLEVSEETEKEFLKTLSLLKTKDPRIYDPNFKCFDKEIDKKEEVVPKSKSLTFEDSDDDDDDNDGNIFKVEKKAEIMDKKKDEKDSKKAKKEKLKEFLTGKAEHLDDETEKDLAPLKALWSDPKISEGEAFLRDYILNKRYLEEGDAVVDQLRDDEDLQADERIVEEQGQFERAYNFRFEEPDEEYLKRFPRTMNFIRPKDTRRAERRAEVRARKEGEKIRKVEEIARLKALKLKEIQDKIAKIKEVTGNEQLAFEEEDIEGDFDPEQHDRRMRVLFDEQFYEHTDEHKPDFPDIDDELEIENWEHFDPEQDPETRQQSNMADEPHCEDDDFNMDADYDPRQIRANVLEEIQSTLGKSRRNRKRKTKLHSLLSTVKPKFVPDVDKTYDQYMEEYYKMDCEDVIAGDLPTRFKYRQVVPNDYGLSIEEILLADDKELTQWVPLKKIVKHRPENVEKGEVKTYAQKAADQKLKKKMLPSLFKDLPEEPEIVVPLEQTIKKKKKKKNRNKQNIKENGDTMSGVEETVTKTPEENIEQNENITNHRDRESNNLDEVNVNTANGIQSNKKKRRKRKESLNKSEENKTGVKIDNLDNKKDNSKVGNNVPDKEGVINKKRKRNDSGFIVEDINHVEPSQASKKPAVNTPKEENKTEVNNINILKDNLKRKTVSSKVDVTPKKRRKKNKKKPDNVDNKNVKEFKNNQKKHFDKKSNKKSDNPLGKLSDERLKAYGLNPKKYRSFLKYKKF